MNSWSDGLLESGFGSQRAAALLDWEARIGQMVAVERALARVQGRLGIIPVEAMTAIDGACDIQRVDMTALTAAAARSATPVIPLVRMLRELVGEPAARWVHHGATSQDVVDTAMILQVREVLDRLEEQLLAVGDRCVDLAEEHRATVAIGRTLGQHAVPVTFGLKAARWAGAVDRRVAQLRECRARVLVLQLGGAAGTLGVLGTQATQVTTGLAAELGLPTPDLPWHAERDRVVELAGVLAGVATVAASVGAEVVTLSRSEIAEVREAGGAGAGSSAMPHKHNPAAATAVRAAARLAMGEVTVLLHAAEQEGERAAGAWQAEWVALPGALVRTLGAVERLEQLVDGLEVDAARMRVNLDAAGGLSASEALASALAPGLGGSSALELVGELSARARAEDRHLATIATEDPVVARELGPAAVSQIFDPSTSLAAVDEMIDTVVRGHAQLRPTPACS